MSVSRTLAFWCGTGLLMIIGAATAAEPLLGAAVAAILLTCLSVAYFGGAGPLVFFGTILIAASAGGPAVPVNGQSGYLVRLAGVGCWIAAGLTRPGHRARPGPPHSTFAARIVAGLSLYGLVATWVAGQVENFAVVVVSIAVLWLCLISTSAWASTESVRRGLVAGLSVFVAGSLVVGVMLPSVGIEQGRLRGLAENANGLGCYAFILAAVAVTSLRSRGLVAAILAMSVGTIVWTGSRNSAIALAIVLITLGLANAGWPTRVLGLLIAAGVVAAALVFTPDLATLSEWLLARGNSRAESFAYAVGVVSEWTWTGVGLGGETVEVASTPLRALVAAGIWGGLAVVATWLAILAYGVRAGTRTTAVALGVIAFSVAEGVLLSPLGPFLLMLLVALVAVHRTETGRRTCVPGHANGTAPEIGHP